MEKNTMITDDLLWDYADGFLDREETLRVDAYLRQHPEHQARLDAILAEKRAFAALSNEKPDAGFAQQVMATWAAEQKPLRAKGRDWVLWGIGAALALMLLLPLWMAQNTAPMGTPLPIPDEILPQVSAPSVDWAGLLNSALLRNALLFSMALMSLKLLDKYLQVQRLRIAGE